MYKHMVNDVSRLMIVY